MTHDLQRAIRSYALGIFDGPHATPAPASEGPVYLGISNITPDGRLDFSEVRHVSEEEFPRWTKRVTPQPGDVVFTYEATLHRYALIPEGFRGCLGRRVALVRPDPEQVDSRYLLYYFLSPSWRGVVEGHVISGATVDRIPIETFPEFPLALPNLPIQRDTADKIGAYDELIQNNRQRVAVLEEAAKSLYCEWFVRLRFPGHEHTPVENGVPRGWRSKKLGELCSEIRETIAPEDVDDETPYIGLEHMPRRSITLSSWGRAGDVTSTKHRYEQGDLLFGKIRPYFHKVGVTLADGVASSDAIVIRANEEAHRSLLLMAVSSDGFVAAVSQSVREGSKMPRADWKFMAGYPVLVPPDPLLGTFSETITSITDQLRTLALQIQRLKDARNLILPRLLSEGVPQSNDAAPHQSRTVALE